MIESMMLSWTGGLNGTGFETRTPSYGMDPKTKLAVHELQEQIMQKDLTRVGAAIAVTAAAVLIPETQAHAKGVLDAATDGGWFAHVAETAVSHPGIVLGVATVDGIVDAIIFDSEGRENMRIPQYLEKVATQTAVEFAEMMVVALAAKETTAHPEEVGKAIHFLAPWVLTPVGVVAALPDALGKYVGSLFHKVVDTTADLSHKLIERSANKG